MRSSATILTAFVAAFCAPLLARPAAAGGVALPPLPAGWPYTTLELGVANPPPNAVGASYGLPLGFRYQYLTGGANTGKGWASWNGGGGAFVTDYIKQAVSDRLMPVFTYYQVYQSAPAAGDGEESSRDFSNLANLATMRAYFSDLKLFFQKSSEFQTKVILHVEPDLWGIMEQQYGDDAAKTPVQVSATGLPELAEEPNNGVGFAHAVKRLRDAYAPNVYLAYHMSVWGTGISLPSRLSEPSTVVADANRAARFYRSLDTGFDLTFGEFSDRDAGFYQYAENNSGRWYHPSDFDGLAAWISTFAGLTGNRIILWQVPVGNRVMRAMNNTPGHYQDNIVETFLSDPERKRLVQYANAGVIGLLFGAGAKGATCPCSIMRHGAPDPEPINGNTVPSYNADDDGGYFIHEAQAYYDARAMTLPASAAR
jgi:hypothetical protein